MVFDMKPRLSGARSISPLLPGVSMNLRVVTLVAGCDLLAMATILTPVDDRLKATLALVAAVCSLALARAAIAASSRTRVLTGQAERLQARLAASELERRELDHSRRMEALRSSTDELTGLLNRRAIKESIRKESNRAVRHRRPLAFLFIDVDHFKRINDVHGHVVGDEVLVELAVRVRSTVRDYDLFARWGGDEFCLVAPEHQRSSDTRALAEHIREAVAAAPFRTLHGPVQVTISIGAVLVDPATPTPEEMCELADAALYRAKRAGRNRIEVTESARGSAGVA